MFKFQLQGRGELVSGQKIGTGYFRDCYSIENHEDICIKVVKTRLSFFRKLQVSFFRINLNQEEFETWQMLPQEIKKYFNPVLEANKNFAVTYIPLNYDGTYALSLRNHKGVPNEKFWEKLDFLFRHLCQNKIWFLDVFNGNNIFVVKKSEEEWSPVIIDYKRKWWRAYPFQLDLVFHFRKKQKLKRQYDRLIRSYRE